MGSASSMPLTIVCVPHTMTHKHTCELPWARSAGHVHKVVPRFQDCCGKYAPQGQTPLEFLQSVYARTALAAHLLHALAVPMLRSDRFSVDLEPVGVAYSIPPQDVAEATLAIKGVLQGCHELHAQGETLSGSRFAIVCILWSCEVKATHAHATGTR